MVNPLFSHNHGVTGSNVFVYIYNYFENLDDVTYQIVSIPTIRGNEYDVRDVTSISNDEKLLIIGRTRTPDRETRVIIYDPYNTDESLIFDLGDIIGAHFSRSEDNEILFINEEGLSALNYVNAEITILNSGINTSWADKALFSPDSSHVAVVDSLREDTGIEQIDLYVYGIQSLIED